MDKHIQKWFSVIFCAILISTMIICLVKPTATFSENENRYLAKLPVFSAESLVSGEFTKQIEKYSTDQFPFRSTIVSLKAHAEKLLGKKESGGVFFASDGYLIEKPSSDNLNILSSNINSINKLSSLGYNTSVALVPTAFEIHCDKLPYGAYTPVQKDAANLASKLCSQSNVNFIDPTSTLDAHKNEYIYFRTDHHQTSYGSYLVYKHLCEKLNIDAYDESEFTKLDLSDEFYGTMWSKAPLFDTSPDTISVYEPNFKIDYKVKYVAENKVSDSLYEKSWLDKKDKYAMFLDANHPIVQISSSNKNGKKLAVFKDSYANSILPFLSLHYEELYIIDLRYFNTNPISYLDENNIDDVLVLYNTSNFISDTNPAKLGAFIK